MDCSRALLLPDLGRPTDRLLKNLALYWDGVVVPVENNGEGLLGFASGSVAPVYAALRDKFGVIEEVPQPLPLDRLLPTVGPRREASSKAKGVLKLRVDDGNPRFDGLAYMTDEELASTPSAPADAGGLAAATSALFAEIAFKRLSAARKLAAESNLAPLAYSLVGHLGSLTGPDNPSVPIREAALISAAIQTFEIDPDVDIERIAKLRDKHRREIGRLRASLTDLASTLDGDAKMDRLMAQARDVVRNRVEPALGDLEAVLNENRIKYIVKSMLGVSALSIGVVQPASGIERAGALTVQTLDYRFSREALVRQHPFGFLHQLGPLRSAASGRNARVPLLPEIADPHRFVREYMRHFLLAVFEDFPRDAPGDVLSNLLSGRHPSTGAVPPPTAP